MSELDFFVLGFIAGWLVLLLLAVLSRFLGWHWLLPEVYREKDRLETEVAYQILEANEWRRRFYRMARRHGQGGCEAGGRHCAGIAHEQSTEQLEEE